MTTCSVPDIVRGDFEYFECADSTPVNDDLPTPVYKAVGDLGIAASDAARPLPRGARRVGRGFAPVGSICRRGGSPWRATTSDATPSGMAGMALAGLSDLTSGQWAGLAAATALFIVVVFAAKGTKNEA